VKLRMARSMVKALVTALTLMVWVAPLPLVSDRWRRAYRRRTSADWFAR